MCRSARTSAAASIRRAWSRWRRNIRDRRCTRSVARFREGPDERPHARAVSEAAGTVHHEVFPTERELVELLPLLIYHMDEPAAGPGVFPQYCVSKLAREHVTVVLGGQGGDEMFGGYTRYLIAYLEECIRGGIDGTQEDDRYVVTFESILPNLPQLRGYEPLLQHFWRDGVFNSPEHRYFRLIDRSSAIRDLVAGDVPVGARRRCSIAFTPSSTPRAASRTSIA